MTDKVQKICEEVERLLNEPAPSHDSQCKWEDGYWCALYKIDEFIDSLQEEPVSEELKEAANNYGLNVRKGYPRVMDETDRYIYNAFKAGAEWQKNHLWKDAQGDDLPEYEREVVVFTQNSPDDAGMMMVAIGHRPTPEGYDGKSLATGEIKHYTPKTYDKGGWNIPDVKYWLDVELPKEMEE